MALAVAILILVVMLIILVMKNSSDRKRLTERLNKNDDFLPHPHADEDNM